MQFLSVKPSFVHLKIKKDTLLSTYLRSSAAAAGGFPCALVVFPCSSGNSQWHVTAAARDVNEMAEASWLLNGGDRQQLQRWNKNK